MFILPNDLKFNPGLCKCILWCLQVAWQTGLRIPTLRIHGLHTNATYFPLRNSEAWVPLLLRLLLLQHDCTVLRKFILARSRLESKCSESIARSLLPIELDTQVPVLSVLHEAAKLTQREPDS